MSSLQLSQWSRTYSSSDLNLLSSYFFKETWCENRDGRWTEWICWRRGHYDSNTPAFKAYPHLFCDIVRRNRDYFLEKYAYYGRGVVKNPKPSGS